MYNVHITNLFEFFFLNDPFSTSSNQTNISIFEYLISARHNFVFFCEKMQSKQKLNRELCYRSQQNNKSNETRGMIMLSERLDNCNWTKITSIRFCFALSMSIFWASPMCCQQNKVCNRIHWTAVLNFLLEFFQTSLLL